MSWINRTSVPEYRSNGVTESQPLPRYAVTPLRRYPLTPLLLWSLRVALLLPGIAWAGTDMSSTSYKIRRSDVNSGGSAAGTSASYKLTGTAGTPGGSLFSGTTYFVYSGFANIVSHPDSIEDLATITGPSTGTLVLTWTAPAAFGSTGTATSYAARYQATPFTTEVSFVSAPIYTQSWSPLVPGGLEAKTLTGLAHNTTYYLAVKGVDQAGNTGYLSNNSGAATLTDAVTNVQIADVGQSSVTLSWTGLGALGSKGYLVHASTLPGFGGTVRSSATADTFQTNLTVFSLRRGKLTYLRVGGLNWNDVPNFVATVSTITLPGPPPGGPSFTNVFASSITLTWGGVASDGGYSAEASVSNTFASVDGSSVTPDVAMSTLTVLSLSANATYYLRVGSLYDDATNYAATTPISTITVAAVPTSGAYSAVYPDSMTVTWSGSINAAGTNFQVDLSSVSSGGVSTGSAVTSALTTAFTGLTQDTTYWARVKALGWAGSDSDYHVIGSAVTGTLTPLFIPTFSGFTDVQLSSVTVAWTLSGPATIAYDVDIAPADPFGVHISSNLVAGPTAVISSLSLNTYYAARVRAHSLVTNNVSGWSNFYSTYTRAATPISLSTTAVSNTYVWLAWNGNGNPSNTLYSIERSTDGVAFVQAGAIRGVAYQDSTVTAGTAYIYRVRALSESGAYTGYTNTVLVMTSGVASAPKRPLGFWAERTDTGGGNASITYHWTRVTQRDDGTTLSNLAGYRIYVSSSLYTPRASWTLQTTIGTEDWPTTAVASDVRYYSVRTVDSGGNLSEWSQILDDTGELNHFFMDSDNITHAQLTQSAANMLRGSQNSYGADLWMHLDHVASEETGRVLRSITLGVTNGSTDSEISNMSFSPSTIRVVIGYTVQGGNVVAGAPEFGRGLSPSVWGLSPGVARAPVINASNAAEQLSLFRFNGNEWVKTTGFVNTADHTVSGSGPHIGAFQIRAATHAPGATLTRVYPRIFTPNGDGWNDKVIFQFDNPEGLPLSGKVFDIGGAFVSNLASGPNPDSSLAWDGKDAGGSPVPGGIYVYQVDVGGTPETGTLVVAR